MKKTIIIFASIILLSFSFFFLYQIIKTKYFPKEPPTTQPAINVTDPTSEEQIVPQQTPIPTSKTIKPEYTPKPPPLDDGNTYACDSNGVCNAYQDPTTSDCPITFKDKHCENRCSDPSTRCRI